MAYLAYVLDKECKEKLLGLVKNLDSLLSLSDKNTKVYCDHVTLYYNPPINKFAELQNLYGETGWGESLDVRINSIVCNGQIIIAMISINKNHVDILNYDHFFHITVACKHYLNPSYSNEMLSLGICRQDLKFKELIKFDGSSLDSILTGEVLLRS